MAIIATQGLTKTYGNPEASAAVKAVDDLTLEVPEGKIFGFLGPNGAGKTTTIKLLLGLIKPDGGEATILGEPMGSIEAKKRLGFLSESPYFYNYLTASEFLEFYCKLFEMGRFQIQRKIEELMPLVGLQGKENVKLSKFSRGMLQRIGIAQSLINDPTLIVLDEPITGLDPKGRKEVKDILLNLKEQGRSIFFCSHVLHDVQEMCTDIGIISRGKLVCDGPISDLLAVKEYHVSADNVPQDTRDKVENMATSVSKTGDTLTATVDNESKFGEVKSILDEKGQNVTVSKTYDSLEDFFLRKIESSGKEEE